MNCYGSKLYDKRLINFNNKNEHSNTFLKTKKLSWFRKNSTKIGFNILAFVFLIIARNLYIKSLLGCDGEEFKCIINSNLNYILDDIYYCTHSVLYFLYFLFLFHLKLCSFYQIFIFLLIIVELIIKDTGDSFLHHGFLNLSALFILLFLGEIFIFILILFINLFKSKNFFHLTQLFISINLLFNFKYDIKSNVKNNSFLKIFIMTHKDFKNFRYNPVYNIVADDESQLKNRYNLTVIFAKNGKLYNKKRAYGEMSKL